MTCDQLAILNLAPERLMLTMLTPRLRYRFELAIGRVAAEFFKIFFYCLHLLDA